MSQELINHSPDLLRLRNHGYDIEIKGGYLVIHLIPYVNSKRQIQFGKLITPLTLVGNKTARPDSHIINFMGEQPCNKDGHIITAIQLGTLNQPLSDEIVMNYQFSNKPPNGYIDYYEKVTRYVEIISSQAKALDSSVTAQPFPVIKEASDDGALNYADTNASRSYTSYLNAKFKGQRIGIVGLGGTGSYILDIVAKTEVSEIHLFDNDVFQQHNAFRAPGAPSVEVLNTQPKKVDYWSSIYSNMHRGIKSHACYIHEDNIHLLKDLSYVFICVDKNDVRGLLMSKLTAFNVPFIDVGLGVNIGEGNLTGIVRTSTGTPLKNDHLSKWAVASGTADNDYATNIQIADLNLINAGFAVVKWKKLSGFYQDLTEEHNTTFTINTAQVLNDHVTT